jgi:hypothetical protein
MPFSRSFLSNQADKICNDCPSGRQGANGEKFFIRRPRQGRCLSDLLRDVQRRMIGVSDVTRLETDMFLDEIRRLVLRLSHPHPKNASEHSAPAAAPSVEFDPVWHGDHWQNLLSSPMDARHYVMEDWSMSPAVDWTDADDAAPAH